MCYYDIEAIKRDADGIAIAEYIGMKVVKKGQKFYIHCPGHTKRLGKVDEHIGNCSISKKGYVCRACGVSIGIVDMVMEYMGTSLKESLGIIADSLGERNSYKLSGKEIPVKPTITNEDLQLIGLYPYQSRFTEVIKTAGKSRDEDDRKCNVLPKLTKGNEWENEYLFVEVVENNSLALLYREDREGYNELIRAKAAEFALKYNDILSRFLNRESSLFREVQSAFNQGNYWEEESLFYLQSIFEKKYRDCLKIFNAHC